eukprot:COSAG01_NODE_35200_length_535_cov_1.672018_2_plen_126_part_01
MDGDGSGEIDAREFQQLLISQQMAQDMSFEIFFNAMFQLAELWTAEAAAPAFVAFLTALLDRIATKSSSSSSSGSAGGAASAACFQAAVLTEIYLCDVCSCHEILRAPRTRVGPYSPLGEGVSDLL